MEDRFLVDGTDLGVDRRRSHATVDAGGVADAAIRAATPFGETAAPALLVVTRVPLRFDGEMFGATVDAELRDELWAQELAEPGDDDTDGASDPAPLEDADPGVQFRAGARVDADGRLTHHAGDRLRFVGTAVLPGGVSVRLDVSLSFGGRRAARL
ncbi:hypothetical protein [Frondihabitans australicus]|uniref:hypothetical protein n=1 Tax=Frondihabitans australicus TaxID=386892 RepID=UPI000EB297F6|nr:hypothetical protein [Frondihabitans australicus]